MTGKASTTKAAAGGSVRRPPAAADGAEVGAAANGKTDDAAFDGDAGRLETRIRYVKASFATLAAFALFGLGLFLLSFRVSSEWGADFAGTIGLATLCGAIGAQFSLLFRLDTLDVDPGAGRDAHDIEAIIRMSMGVFAAIIAVAAVRVALGVIVPNGTDQAVDGWLIPIVALVAGAGERFVPGVLLKTSLLNTEAVPEGTHLGDAPLR